MKPSAAARLIAAKKQPARAWTPAPGEQFECVDEIVKHNLTAPPRERVGAPSLSELFAAEFKVSISTAVMGRYMRARTAELVQAGA